MKILKETEDILVIKNYNLIDIFIGGSAFFIMWLVCFSGIFLFPMFQSIADIGVEKLSCKKVQPTIANCELSKSTFMGLVKGKPVSIEGVKAAKVEQKTETDDEGNSTSVESVFLVTNEGNVPLSNQTGNDIKLFNKYIQTAVGEFIVEKESDRLQWVGFLIPSIIMGIPGFLLSCVFFYCATPKTYIFDKKASTLTTKVRGLSVNEVYEQSLSEISKVELGIRTESNGNQLYHVSLVINGRRKPLPLEESKNREDEEKMVDLIRSYLDDRSESIIND